ncbi:hypothetical protein C5746_17950 [Streptomyces atratus]|uniref:Histidine kinase-like ATPase domain-containing protein n=1 Tax=Streptomyces atratus TaxID=1893 RepID=A0A2Z5JDM9_STRAR|nr:hypothetical protein C5746_17950 [Streptomyces atratus]
MRVDLQVGHLLLALGRDRCDRAVQAWLFGAIKRHQLNLRRPETTNVQELPQLFLGERRLRADAESGYGLHLVEALATSWGITDRVVGKTVWAELFAGHH